MSGSSPLIQVDDVVAGYLPGVHILNGCSMELHPGEVIGIVGPNGAGKSTLLKAVFGLLDISSGTVRHSGVDVTNKPPHDMVTRGVGYVPQVDNVFPQLTIKENLEMGVFQKPKTFERRFEAVAGLFPLLAERQDQRADGLSGGQRQMVAIGRALMMDPQVVLLDEPSAGLSPAYTDLVFDQITGIARHGVSLILVEQNARRCLEISDRGYVLDQGTNAYTGTGRELLDDPKVVSLYLGTLMGS